MSRRWIGVLACLAVAGCGSEPQLDAEAAGALRGEVEAVRAAAGAGDRAGALRALDRLAVRIERGGNGGELSEEDAAALRQGVRRARRGVEREIPEPTPEPTATPEPVPTAAPEQAPQGGGDDGEESDD